LKKEEMKIKRKRERKRRKRIEIIKHKKIDENVLAFELHGLFF